MDYFKHESSYIENCNIGNGTKVWHFCHLFDSSIGKNCVIGQNVMIGPKVVVGNGCKIQNNVSLYEGVVLEDDVFVGPSVVFTNVINPRAFIARRDEFKETIVAQGSTIGANATIICGITIGRFAVVGAGAVVTKDVAPYTVIVGNPAEYLRSTDISFQGDF